MLFSLADRSLRLHHLIINSCGHLATVLIIIIVIIYCVGLFGGEVDRPQLIDQFLVGRRCRVLGASDFSVVEVRQLGQRLQVDIVAQVAE